MDDETSKELKENIKPLKDQIPKTTYKHHMYNNLKWIANKFNMDLLIQRKSKLSKHGLILTNSNYSPWKTDIEFKKVHLEVFDYTLVDKYRLYELWDLVEQTSKLKEGIILEVGAWKGGSGALMAYQADLNFIDEDVYLCDTFKGVVKAGEEDIVYTGGEHADAKEEDITEIFKKLELTNYQVLTGVFPEDTGHFIDGKKIRLCHIDVDVYQSAKDTLDYIWHQMVVGGVIIFDDYGFNGCYGVTKLVDEQRHKKDRLVLYNLNGHGLIIKIK